MRRLDFQSYMSSGIYAHMETACPCEHCSTPTTNVRPVLNPDGRTFTNRVACTIECARALSRKES